MASAATSAHGGTAPLAALTAIFTTPPLCPGAATIVTTKAPSQYPPFAAAASAAPSVCAPPSWAVDVAGRGFQYYSPAICPSGLAVGAGCSGVPSAWPSQGFPAVEAGETVAWCVPSGFSCVSDTTDFRGGMWGATAAAAAVAPATAPAITVAPALQIRWRDVDLSSLETHPLIPGLTLDSSLFGLSFPSLLPTASEGGGDGGGSSGGSGEPSAPFPLSILTLGPGTSETTRSVTTSGTEVSRSRATSTNTSASPMSAVTGGAATSSSLVSPSQSVGDGAGSPDGSNGSKSQSSPQMLSRAALAGIIVGSLVAVLLLAVLAFALLRHRRRNQGLEDGDRVFKPVGVGVWVQRGGRGGPGGKAPPQMREVETQVAENEPASSTERDSSPLGEEAQQGQTEGERRRWSWMSRVSRALNPASPRSWRTPPPIPPSSTAGSRWSTARSSRWTARTDSEGTSAGGDEEGSGGFDAFVRERWPNGLAVPVSVAAAAAGTRPLSPAVRTPRGDRADESSHRGSGGTFPGQGMFQRLSDGTFGRLRSPVESDTPGV